MTVEPESNKQLTGISFTIAGRYIDSLVTVGQVGPLGGSARSGPLVLATTGFPNVWLADVPCWG